MPSQHKHSPIPFRPPEGDRARLQAHAEQTGQPVNRILTKALAAYLDAAAHPKGNHWFASHWQGDDEPAPNGFPWRVYIQLPGMVDHLNTWFPTRQATEQFIRDDILGADLDDD